MHELGATKTLVDLIVEECRKQGIERPISAVVEVGALTTYSPESIKFYFDALKNGNPVIDKTELETITVGAEVVCRKCGKKSILDDPWFIICPECDCREVDIVSGRDLTLKQIKFK